MGTGRRSGLTVWGRVALDWASATKETLKYHRLSFADPQHSSWQSLAEGLLSLALYLLVVSFLPGAILLSPSIREACGPEVGLEATGCAQLWAIIGAAAWLPLALAARALLGPWPFGMIWSVMGRLRWRLLGDCLLITLAVTSVMEGSRYLLAIGAGIPIGAGIGDPAPLVLGLLLLLVPLQVTAEEVVFRGYLLQTVGRWLASPVLVVLVPAPLFLIGHLGDTTTGVVAAVMALATGFLCVRTGGLEAGIAVHLGNNLTALFLPPLIVTQQPGLAASWVVHVFTNVVTLGLLCAVVSYRADAKGWVTELPGAGLFQGPRTAA